RPRPGVGLGRCCHLRNGHGLRPFLDVASIVLRAGFQSRRAVQYDSAANYHRKRMMSAVTLEYLKERLELADQLSSGRDTMLEPQDLPGRYGRVVKAVDHLLQVMNGEAVLGGGWAVWRHGFVGRVTEDIDIVLAADRVEEFLRVAALAGFEILPQKP